MRLSLIDNNVYNILSNFTFFMQFYTANSTKNTCHHHRQTNNSHIQSQEDLISKYVAD